MISIVTENQASGIPRSLNPTVALFPPPPPFLELEHKIRMKHHTVICGRHLLKLCSNYISKDVSKYSCETA